MNQRESQRRTSRKQARLLARRNKVPSSKAKQRRAKSTPQIVWLRDLICLLVYGEKSPVGVRPSIKKVPFLKRWDLGLRLPSLANYKFEDHFNARQTYYYFGRGDSRDHATLVMIDIDVQKSKGLGSPKGARQFAQHLKSIWPSLYFERSTGGKGMHGYFVLLKCGCDALRTNKALKRLEQWLRQEAKKVNADIELVEIKGTCLDMTFDRKKLQSLKYGTFAKLPREVSRFAEWEATTELRVQDLESTAFDVVNVDHTHVINQTPSYGSISGKLITEDDLACLPAYEKLADVWIGEDGLKAGKWRVNSHDFAIAMLLMKYFKSNPNKDGTMPCRRVEELWTALFVAGDVTRPWNHHRWKAIRDFLSEIGHLDWVDHRYEFPGEGKGIACKWSISEGYNDVLESVASLLSQNRGEASFVDTEFRLLIPPQGNGQFLKPKPFPLRAEMEQRFWFKAYEACELLCAA